MTIDVKIRDEKLQYDIDPIPDGEGAKRPPLPVFPLKLLQT